MINPLERFQEFKGWIPTEDVDGIDCPKDYLRDATNIDFENGFTSNAPAPVEVPLPEEISNLVTNGWEILRRKYFNHTEQGDTFFTILYKYDSEHKLKFYVNNTEVIIDEIEDDVTIGWKPLAINFLLVNDQLKINLNVTGTYNSMSKSAVLNLTLCYLSYHAVYGQGLGNHFDRQAGWYLFPRWLGWSYTDPLVSPTLTDSLWEFNGSIEAAQNGEIIAYSNVSIFAGSPVFDVYSGSGCLEITQNGSFQIGNIDYAAYIEFAYDCANTPSMNACKITIKDGNDEILYSEVFEATGYYWKTKKIALPFLPNIKIQFTTEDKIMNPFLIDKLKVSYNYEKYVVLAKNFDGQRGLVQSGTNLNKNAYYKIDKKQIDWRVDCYELYAQIVPDSDIYYLIHTAYRTEAWNEATYTGYLTLASIAETFDYESVTTLNFNYGLGAVPVFFIEGYSQRKGIYIYSEAFYRNRSYFVNLTEKLYYSHLSGTGQVQPDSFPMDVDIRFGFYVTSQESKNKSVSVTQMDELLIITDKSNWVFSIEGSIGTPLKKIKAINGGYGCLNFNLLPVDLSGSPLCKALLWFDRWAVYAYGGGRALPVSVTGNSHKNYWQLLLNKEEAIAFYNKARNEYWIQIDGKILVYELNTGTWKKYVLPYTITDVVGIKDDYTYILAENKMYKLDPVNPERLDAIVEFHDTTVMEVSERGYTSQSPEIQDKILQDMFIHFKDPAPTSISVEVISDDNLIDPKVEFNAAYSRLPIQSPLLIVFGKIRFRITISSTSAKLKEFGFAYTVLDSASPIHSALSSVTIKGIGQESGGESGVVF